MEPKYPAFKELSACEKNHQMKKNALTVKERSRGFTIQKYSARRVWKRNPWIEQ